MKTREITTCAFSIALGIILLVSGFHLTFGEYFWYFWAALMISFPETRTGKCCTLIATGLLSLLLCGQYLYLCSYLLWLGPYSLLWCLTEPYRGKWVPVLRYLFFLAGALIVLWTTPMLFIQLGGAAAQTKLTGAALAALICIPACFGYSLLYRNMRNLLKERVLQKAL